MKVDEKYFARVVVAFTTILLMALPARIFAASMGDYCVQPPYVKTNAKPNVMIIMDNAYDMGEPAYCIKGTNYATDHTCTENYNPATTYGGYFKTNQRYKYGSNRFVPDSNGVYSGNLLNWATTSKYDLLENILVGGISTSRQSNINTIVSKSNVWKKTFTYVVSGQTYTCIVNVNNANVEFTEPTNGACGLFNSTPVVPPNDLAPPCPSCLSFSVENPVKAPLSDPAAPAFLAVEMNQKHARNETLRAEDEKNHTRREPSMLKKAAGSVLEVLTAIADFLVTDAEAATPLRIAGGPSILPSGTECTDGYTVTISASGGSNSGYTWKISAGSLPPGLSMATSGTPDTTISGAPTTDGPYTFTVEVTDDQYVAATGTEQAKHIDSKEYTININALPLTITPTLLHDGEVDKDYIPSVTFSVTPAASSVSNACTPYTWSIVSDPDSLFSSGMTLSPEGVLSGKPTAFGSFSFTVMVRNKPNSDDPNHKEGDYDTQDFTLKINPPGAMTIVVDMPDAINGNSYTAGTITVSNCTGGVCSDWVFSNRPTWLDFNFNNGQKTSATSVGTAACNGSCPTVYSGIKLTVNDGGSTGHSASTTFSVTVNANVPKPRTSGNLNVKICAGSYTNNCTNNENTTPLKSGLIDQFWSQARFGLMSFDKRASAAIPTINECVSEPTSSIPDPNFMTDVENAVFIDPTTTLVNGEYMAVDSYQTDAGSCHPFSGAPKCTKSFVLIITAGVGADNPANPVAGTGKFTTDIPAVCTSETLTNLAKNSCYGYNIDDLRSDVPGRQYVSTYIVNTLGTAATTTNPDIAPVTSGDALMQAAKKGGGIYYEVQDPALVKANIQQALQDIIKRAAGGTAASVLASGEGSGANLIQAVFYPRRQFGNNEIDWIGRLANFWYYVDPNLNSSTIREDAGAFTVTSNGVDYFAAGDNVLTLKTEPTGTRNDHIVQFYFDTNTETTKAYRWNDNNGNALISDETTSVSKIDFESVGSLWEAGNILWNRNLKTSSRTIKTTIGSGLIDLSTSNAAALTNYLQAANSDEASKIINWVQGYDKLCAGTATPCYQDSDCSGGSCIASGYRSRSVTIDGSGPNTWKLADVLNSTPKISSWLPLNTYHKMYGDNTYGVPGKDPSLQNAADDSHYITSTVYRGRNLIFAGANDGMLHAFKLGTLELHWDGMGEFDKARLTGTDLGKEMWAFIPKNALPYLKYLADPNYCHVYTIDLTPFVFDASIGDVSNNARTASSWRTILIGGMRYGGACKPKSDTCSTSSPNGVCAPAQVVEDGVTKDIGYSSYFALDITDQNNPQLLWEFSHPQLGFSTSGPAVVRINGDGTSLGIQDKNTNGHWFVVFGSGPTGPINADPNSRQFLGRSDQNLRLFILNLKGPGTGNWTENTNFWIKDSGIASAFAGSLFNSTLDTDLDYQDDVVYIPYVKNSGSGWTDGGVLRLSTKGNTSPALWDTSKLIDNIGPVTAAVTKLQNNSTNTLWTFFGTGRYYYQLNGNPDDADGQRQIFGIKEPCFKNDGFHSDCTDSRSINDTGIINVTDIDKVPTNPDDANFEGWYIDLDAYQHNGTATDPTVNAERVITDPVATSSGIVFFTTFKPYTDECQLGGKSFIWAVKYNSGGDASAYLKGQALIQVSTGSIEQLDLSKAFKDSVTGLNTGNRKTAGMEGVPPYAQGLSIISTPPPVKRVMHVKER